jgi:transcriptional regulator with XRE-family HTH domain
MVHAMDDFAARLAALMAGRGMGVLAVARRVPCDKALISRLRAGKERPSARVAARLDDVLGAGGELVALAPGSRPAAGSLDLIELARRAQASDVSAGTADLLAAATDHLCQAYPATSAEQLAAETRKHLGYVTRLLERRVTLAQHRELLVAAGWLAALLACCCYDAGDRAAAEVARMMTRQFGDATGHGTLVAWSFEIAAWIALVEGRYRDTVELAEAGLEHAGVTSAAVQLSLQAARGYARMGDPQARKALAGGRALLDRLPGPEHPEHHFAFDAGKYEFYVGTVLTWLGDDATAEEHARHVLAEGRCGRWPMRAAMSQLDLAVIAGRRGELDEAVALAASALAHPRRTAQILPRAAELGRELAEQYPGEPLVTGYGELLAAQHNG